MLYQLSNNDEYILYSHIYLTIAKVIFLGILNYMMYILCVFFLPFVCLF